MTDGTSQGLFVTVAIVVFGIFVVMAYILFEDTLSPAMANMFTTATEQASKDLRTSQWDSFNVVPSGESFGDMELLAPNTYQISSFGTYFNGDGIHIPHRHFVRNKNYVATYDIEVVEGTVERWGGRLSMSDATRLYINDSYIGGNYSIGHNYTMNKGERYSVRVEFNSNLLDKQLENGGTNERLANFYIQPNRNSQSINDGGVLPYTIIIHDLTFTKVN